MTLAELNRALDERKFPTLLFLFGEESFTLDRTAERIRDLAVPAESRDFNYNVFYGKEGRAEEILDVLRTLPAFAERRLVHVKEAQNLSAAELDVFLSYLKDPVPESILLFTADKIDGRKKFFQDFKKHGSLIEFKKPYDNQIPGFVKEMAKEAGRLFTESALALFCKRGGSNLQELHGELTKLFAYAGDRDLIDVDDVAAIVSDSRVDSVFDLANALGKGDAAEALRLLQRILAEGVAPLLILNMMVRHFRQLWKTRELLDQGVSSREIPKRIGINPYFLDGLVGQARRFRPDQFRAGFELFLGIDLALKSSGAHPAALLEKLILDLVGTRA
jgi:DNA polymerase-3 subunit delta